MRRRGTGRNDLPRLFALRMTVSPSCYGTGKTQFEQVSKRVTLSLSVLHHQHVVRSTFIQQPNPATPSSSQSC